MDDLVTDTCLDLMRRLSTPGYRPTAEDRASRAASRLYCLGLATNPDAPTWRVTRSGRSHLSRA